MLQNFQILPSLQFEGLVHWNCISMSYIARYLCFFKLLSYVLPLFVCFLPLEENRMLMMIMMVVVVMMA